FEGSGVTALSLETLGWRRDGAPAGTAPVLGPGEVLGRVAVEHRGGYVVLTGSGTGSGGVWGGPPRGLRPQAPAGGAAGRAAGGGGADRRARGGRAPRARGGPGGDPGGLAPPRSVRAQASRPSGRRAGARGEPGRRSARHRVRAGPQPPAARTVRDA